MKIYTLLASIAILTTSASIFADGQLENDWINFWDAGGGATATGGFTVIAPDGSIYVTAISSVASDDIVLIKYDTDGTILWLTTYDGPASANDAPTDMELTDEGVSIVGTSPGLTGPQTVLLNYDSSGKLLWEKRTIGPIFSGIFRPQLEIGSDGRRVIGTDDNKGSSAIEAYTKDGEVIFQSELLLEGFSGVSTIAIDSKFNIYVVAIENFNKYVVRKFDPNGNLLWQHIESSDTLVLSEAYIAVMDNDEVIVAGSPELPCVTIKARVWRLTVDGEMLWIRDLPEDVCDFGVVVDMIRAPNGGVYLAAIGAFFTSFLALIDDDGTIQWLNKTDGTVNSIDFKSLAISPTGSAIVGATIAPVSDFVAFDVLVQCYDVNGDLGWSAVFAGPDNSTDFTAEAASGADGSVSVVATIKADDNNFQNIVTLHYSANLCPADVNGDDVVGISDLLAVLGSWGSTEGGPEDINNDGLVGITDLLVLLAAWGPC